MNSIGPMERAVVGEPLITSISEHTRFWRRSRLAEERFGYVREAYCRLLLAAATGPAIDSAGRLLFGQNLGLTVTLCKLLGTCGLDDADCVPEWPAVRWQNLEIKLISNFY